MNKNKQNYFVKKFFMHKKLYYFAALFQKGNFAVSKNFIKKFTIKIGNTF
jgi:hypothetical protein